jgi:DNA-binding winged helix-turn-helix (wHTH) protein
VPLQNQPARVLCLLVSNSGQLVTRDELRLALWSGDTFVEFETALNIAIAKIRQALGDAASSPRFIETLPRRGYRFIADVHPADGDLSQVSRDTASSLTAPVAHLPVETAPVSIERERAPGRQVRVAASSGLRSRSWLVLSPGRRSTYRQCARILRRPRRR